MENILLFRKAMLLSSLLLLTSICFAQVTEQWVRRYNGRGKAYDVANSIGTDAAGNVYVTGQSENGKGFTEFATIKYNAAGDQVWVRNYHSAAAGANDRAVALVVDVNGYVYVTGQGTGSNGTGQNYITIKYDRDGHELWSASYNGGIYDQPSSLAVDAWGNVSVTGVSYDHLSETYYDYATVKYDKNGKQLWAKKYNGANNGYDAATVIAMNINGSVCVTGYSDGKNGYENCVTIQYNANGQEQWVRRYTGAGMAFSRAVAIDSDAAGNVYVASESSEGPELPGFTSIKYDVKGNQLWVKSYRNEQPGSLGAHPSAMAVDGKGNVYVTGYDITEEYGGEFGGNFSKSYYVTIKYGTNGNELWLRRYKGIGHDIYDGLTNSARALVLDAPGNVYVTGQSSGEKSDDYYTIKYDSNGNELWAMRYDGEGKGDAPNAIAVDEKDHVYVTGMSMNREEKNDYATLLYKQTEGSMVSSFSLVNAEADKDIRVLRDYDTVNLAAWGHQQLNFRANTLFSKAGSVVFQLSGPKSYSRTENKFPYALFGDQVGDYYSASLSPGDYTLTATPYNGYRGIGKKGTPLTIHFHVLYQEVSSFTLVNADTDQDIRELKEGDVIDLSALDGMKFNVRANTKPAKVGSVVFDGGFGAQNGARTENQPPYAALGDVEGDYNGAVPADGEYTLTATPYSGYRGTGQKGAGKTIHFKVVHSSLNNITRGGDLQWMEEKPEAFKVSVAPNPISTTAKILYELPVGGSVSIRLFDAAGKQVVMVMEGERKAGVYRAELDAAGLVKGVYYYRALLTSGGKTYTQTGKLMVVK